jgi:phospholipid/cholesterol/gamma-HCH transport system permease protein
VIPRIIAAVTMVPILALVCMWAGVGGGMLIARTETVSFATFQASMSRFVMPHDFLAGLIKAPVFGLIVAVVACQQGLRTKQGAVGVGRATTNTVVIAMVLVYIANFLLARLLFAT